MFNTKQLTSFLVKKKVTPTQLYIISCIQEKDFRSLGSYIEKLGNPKAEIIDLINKGIIIDLNKDGESYVDSMMISDSFSRGYIIESGIAGEQIWNLYPWWFIVNGDKFPAKTTDKDALIELYGRRINNSYSEHKKVLKILEHLVNTESIVMGIQKWVSSEQWNAVDLTKTTFEDDWTTNVNEIE